MLSKSQEKLIRSLRQVKFRRETGLFIAEGPKVVNELLDSRFELEFLVATESYSLPENPQTSGVILISPKQLQRLSALKTANEVIGVFRQKEMRVPEKVPGKALLLSGISDPGNMGTILRLADWFDIPLVACTPGCVDRYSPKVVQATMGSLARVDFPEVNTVSWLKEIKPELIVAGTHQDGKPVQDFQPEKPVLLVIGSESHGIAPEIAAEVDEWIGIPSPGARNRRAESLNAAVATAIFCYHLWGNY
ncbi:MAG: RNA methyltransferase [Bacteroidales bacterium]